MGEEGDPFSSMSDIDTMTPEGHIPATATSTGGDAPQDAIGSMQHMISQQVDSLKGTKHKGVYFKDQDPADPERVIKGKGDKQIVPVMQDPKVAFCDLATDGGRERYEEVMSLLAKSLGTYQLFGKEPEPHIEIGPDGVPHAFVILKYCKVTKVVSVKQPKYAEISEELMKEKFFPNHEETDLTPEESGDGEGDEPEKSE